MDISNYNSTLNANEQAQTQSLYFGDMDYAFKTSPPPKIQKSRRKSQTSQNTEKGQEMEMKQNLEDYPNELSIDSNIPMNLPPSSKKIRYSRPSKFKVIDTTQKFDPDLSS